MGCHRWPSNHAFDKCTATTTVQPRSQPCLIRPPAATTSASPNPRCSPSPKPRSCCARPSPPSATGATWAPARPASASAAASSTATTTSTLGSTPAATKAHPPGPDAATKQRQRHEQEDAQAGDELYADNGLDRGHLVRRADAIWGTTEQEAQQGNTDTFHYSNAAPQAAKFNQGELLWLSLEHYLPDDAATYDRRLIVFTGPVFDLVDPAYRGVQIPLRFFKVAVFRDGSQTTGPLAATGYLLDQTPPTWRPRRRPRPSCGRRPATATGTVPRLPGAHRRTWPTSPASISPELSPSTDTPPAPPVRALKPLARGAG